MKKLIIIADWASDTLTSQEVRSAIEGFVKEPVGLNITLVASTPSTIHTGFLLAQVVETEERYGRPLETVIFQNTDPRLHTDSSIETGAGAEPVVLRLVSGLYVCGPNAGYDFSFLKHKIDEFYSYKGLNMHGQFNSRDLFARISAHLMDAMEDELDLEETHTNLIPVLEKQYVGHIDNFGNIKTTITADHLKGKYEYGDEVSISINNVTLKATLVKNLFAGHPGRLVLYPGSSGSPDNTFLEVSVWRHFTEENPTTGVDLFNHPRPGAEVHIA